MKLTIQKKEYAVEFGYGAYKILLRHYGLKKLSELQKVLKKLDVKKGTEPTLEWYDILGLIGSAGIEFATGERVNPDKVVDVLMRDKALLEQMSMAFVESFPKDEGSNPGIRGK